VRYAISEQGHICPCREFEQFLRCDNGVFHNSRDCCCHLGKNFGPTGHHHTRNSPLPRVGAVPNASAIFQMHAPWKSCSVRVFRAAWDFASITSIVSKWWPSVLSQSVKQRKGDDSHVVTGQTFPKENGSMVRCVVMVQMPVIFPTESSGRNLCTFLRSCRKCHSCMRNWLTGLPGRILLWTISLLSKKMISMLLTLYFICLACFRLSRQGSCSLLRTLVYTLPGCCTFSELFFSRNLTLFVFLAHCEITPGQMHSK
jgi:hypothetical protein